ncbi:response regulator transcription factor [Sphaerotilus montanus]|jgi:DNA-binding NarL/FixJ family response regulator|uniref:DNA-binding NarL/FixJ family response regulator n=1 Tax=Sphaerotilus montanus TaxID=522889 RepID=A0A7Y9UM15_9BURK|nr:response regulator transcription factor [Sphaerotilus montanus]NYG35370.1 DNA-binding NarL/FixJ family response regulator [Sphaerotilus montanus]NZD58107.1 response regulator transcription factor [Sphaerotilus montanus]
MIRILLLDDHAVVRAGYRQLIDAEADMQVAAEASTSAQACELIRQQEIDVAVVDLSLKGDSGLEAIRRLRERQPDLKVLIFTMHAQESYALQALRAGALGYLTKDSDPEDMLDALRQVARGRRVFSGEIAQALLSDVARAGQGDLLDRLTPREFDVLRLVTSGETIGEIAQALHISEKTVFNTMSLVRQKLDVRSDFKLLRLAVEQGLVQL